METKKDAPLPAVDIVLTDSFPMLSLSLVIEPMRVANRETRASNWRWRILSVEGGTMTSSSGLPMVTAPLDAARADAVLLLSSYHPETALVPKLLGWLRDRARQTPLMGCVDTGALIFAEAGLLTRIPAAVHFEALGGYREKFADALFVDRLFHLEGNRCSSAGGVATFDMMLALIARFDSTATARRVAEILTYLPSDHTGPQQRLLMDTTLARTDRTLARAIELMLGSLSAPLGIGQIAERLGVPEWTLARLFRRHLNTTPSDYFRELRLAEARNLLRNTSLRISEVAALCGFENPETFARAYRRRYGCTASEERRSATNAECE